uniref:RING-type E3 ubiquitin transferase n=1 Tax=Ananas comosus var. bracteatus TaxID=296719 RepID=A0A6V7Q5A0_ANACO|nr:unnamed protein product [Ananas comosus var. bracteatus]
MPRLVSILLALFLLAAGRSTIVSGNDADGDFFKKCPASRCAEGGPEIRFPYRLDSSPSFCGAHGMELSCSGNDTVVALPHAGSFNVTTIDYLNAEITVKLGCSCLTCLTRNLISVKSLNLTTSIYQPLLDGSDISLLGCPTKWTPDDDYDAAGPISCLSTASQFVYVLSADGYAGSLPSNCRVIADDLSISFRHMTEFSSDYSPTFKERVADLIARGEVTVGWYVPQITGECILCEKAKKYCGFSSATNQPFCRQGRNVKLIAGAYLIEIFVSAKDLPFYLKSCSIV